MSTYILKISTPEGYIYNGDITKEPDSYICPICKKPKSVFTKV